MLRLSTAPATVIDGGELGADLQVPRVAEEEADAAAEAEHRALIDVGVGRLPRISAPRLRDQTMRSLRPPTITSGRPRTVPSLTKEPASAPVGNQR